jgi:hypothetical protein
VTDFWQELDPWWRAYIETGHETAVELEAMLNRSNERWRDSGAPFDSDPLAADLTLDRRPHGPLQPGKEENWSEWLARLLAPAPSLVSELFDVQVDHAARTVARENQISKDSGSFRRPDVLLFYPDRGVHIEVKLGDTNYAKTAETANLVEREYDGVEWTHVLLLSKAYLSVLRLTVDQLSESQRDDQLWVEWADPGPVSFLLWKEVTRGIRSLLLRGDYSDDHWAANAHLFCAIAEQQEQILNFQPQALIEEMANPQTAVDTLQPVGITDVLEKQLMYFHESSEL